MTPQQEKLVSSNPISAYKELAVGDRSLLYFLWFEILNLFISGIPGFVGFALRTVLYPSIFKKIVGRAAFGRGIVLRNSSNVSLGKRVMIDDYAVLDVRGSDSSITFGDFVTVGRFSTVTAKHAVIDIQDGANVGSYCRIATQSKVKIGRSVLIGAYSYIGPGNHQRGDENTPLISREMEIKGGVEIGDHVWIGAGVTILDGVKIGDGAVVGANSLVRDDVPAGVTVVGVPAKIVKSGN